MSGMDEDKDREEEANEDDDEEDENAGSRKYAEIRKQGQDLYSALHLLFYTGFFRMLSAKDFPYILAMGYSLEIILSFIPMFFLQVMNYAETMG